MPAMDYICGRDTWQLDVIPPGPDTDPPFGNAAAHG